MDITVKEITPLGKIGFVQIPWGKLVSPSDVI